MPQKPVAFVGGTAGFLPAPPRQAPTPGPATHRTQTSGRQHPASKNQAWTAQMGGKSQWHFFAKTLLRCPPPTAPSKAAKSAWGERGHAGHGMLGQCPGGRRRAVHLTARRAWSQDSDAVLGATCRAGSDPPRNRTFQAPRALSGLVSQHRPQRRCLRREEVAPLSGPGKVASATLPEGPWARDLHPDPRSCGLQCGLALSGFPATPLTLPGLFRVKF